MKLSELLLRLSLPYVARHRLRTAVTVFGVALGVAAIVALRLAYEPISRSYRVAVKRLAGRSSIQVSNGDIGVPEDLLDEIRKVPGVAAAAASVRGFVRLPAYRGEELYVLGVDMLDDQQVRDYGDETPLPSERPKATAPSVQSGTQGAASTPAATMGNPEKPLQLEDPLVFLAKADSVALSPEFLRENHLKVGDTIEVQATSGRATLRIRGTLDSRRGVGSLYGGRLALMDIFAAEKLFHLDHRFTQIDVVVKPGADINRVAEAIAGTVQGRGVVEAQEASFQAAKALLDIERSNTTFEALGAMLVGLYLIFNTMLIAVAQRRREIGILRSLGMQRRGIVKLILAEAGLLGVVGCALGLPLGVGLAHFMSLPFVFRLAEARVPVMPSKITIDLFTLGAASGIGIVGAVVAAIIPAREALKVDPLEALRPYARRDDLREIVESGRRYWISAVCGVTVFLVTFVVWFWWRKLIGDYQSALLAMGGFLVGASLMVPLAVRWFTRAVEPVLKASRSMLVTMANRALLSHLGRMAITTTVFVMCFSFVTEVGAAYATLSKTFERWFNALFANADLIISVGDPKLRPNVNGLPDSLVDEISKVDGVAGVSAVRLGKLNLNGYLVDLIAMDIGAQKLDIADGDPKQATFLLATGRAVAIDERLAYTFGLKRGEILELASPRGMVRAPIAAVVHHSENFRDMGAIVIDRRLYRMLWGDRTVDLIEPKLKSGADAFAVMREIRRRWGDEYGLFITSVGRFKKQARREVEEQLAEVPPILAIALAIAVMAVVSSLLAAVLDRIRELGILRAVGASRGQVTALIVLEAGLVGLIGAVLAAAIGVGFGYYQFAILSKSLNGVSLVYSQPIKVIILASAGALFLPALAAILPAHRASQLEVSAALASE